MSLTSFAVKNYQFTIILFVLALALGANALINMPRGEDPPFGAPIFIIQAVYPGTSPVDMEQLVADPLEEVLYNLDNIKKMQTFCGDGLMLIQLEFTYGVNVDNKNNDVVREVNKVRPSLPSGLFSLDVIRAASSDVCILQTALVSSTASSKEQTDKAEELKKQLERIKDIKWVKVQAEPVEEINIALQLDKMARYGIGLNQVINIIQANNVNIPGGSVDLGKKLYNIKTNSELSSMDELRNIIVKTTPQGNTIHLTDIATVRMDKEEDTHIARFNGQPAIWVVTALKDRKNIIQNRVQIQKVLDEFEPTLPDNIKMQTSFDQEKNVRRRLYGLGTDFLIAVSLVLLTLLPLGWRAALIVMISIPLSLAVGLAFFNYAGYTLNQLSIVGMVIALGLLVDDSIVIVENIERFMRMGYNRKDAAIVATKQIVLAVIGCTATLLLAFLPLVFLPEGSGEFIRPLPMAVLLTILASLFVSITIIPFLASMILKKHERPEGNVFMRAFKKYINAPYQRVLKVAFVHPVMALVITGAIFVGSLFLIPKIGFSLFPVSEKPMFNVDIHTPDGTTLKETNRIARLVEQDLLSTPNVLSVSTNVGKGNPRVYYNLFQHDFTPNYAQLFVQTNPEMGVPEIVAMTDSLRVRYGKIPGANVEVKQFQQGPPVPAPIEFRILGNNLDTLTKYGHALESIFKKTHGTLYVGNDLRLPKTDLKVVIDKEKAGVLGVLPAEVAKTVRLGIAGLPNQSIRNADGDEYDILMTVEDKDPDKALDVFKRMYVTSLSGALIPLTQVADIQPAESPGVIRHYNKERYTSVTSFVQTGYNTIAMFDDIEKKLDTLKLPAGYRFVAAGEKETRQESFGGMGSIILITFFGLFGILVLEFRTFKSTLIVLSVIPLGIVGALVILYLSGETLSFVATIGMVALMGIEIKNSILLVDYTNQLRENGMPLKEAVMNGAETRFLPILLTSMTAIGGMIPLVMENSPLISPLALVLIGGLISSTLLSRIVTPLLYMLIPPAVVVTNNN
ncbi:MAG: efflux RND transporter permease subunit [Saprospiraceae bacterium]|uniref:Efflux RND transporter permease subunit n=1 Tax=Candidatus Opimibacter skivensis TaxID=2982028 RepID=A0A9D7SVA5_9BACT|nr:efflux RND transporter permease subunit [Candidatus Opimibacter skivensis]